MPQLEYQQYKACSQNLIRSYKQTQERYSSGVIKVTVRNNKCSHTVTGSTPQSNQCHELIVGHPNFVGIMDAALEGTGGVVIGEADVCVPTVL